MGGTAKVSFDVKALGAEIGKEVKEGTLSKGVLKVGRKTFDLKAGGLVDAAKLKELGNGKVPVIVSDDTVVAIGYPPWHWPCFWLCYIPAPDIFREIDPAIREALAKQYVKLNIIPEGMAKTFVNVKR